MILASKVVDVCNCCCNDNTCINLPSFICGCFDGDLVLSGENRRLYVTIGQFSIIRMERDTQLRIPCYSYCIPTKDCSATGSNSDESPCDMFSKIQFPVASFFPACGERECGSVAGTSTGSCGCGTVAGTSTGSCGSVAGTSSGSCGCRTCR